MTTKAKWTILTYIAANNNLDQLGEDSLRKIQNIGSTRDVFQGALYDGNRAGAARYVMGDAGKVLRQEDLGSFDSGDPNGVIDTAKWLFENYPAERYGLVLWSHGSGWEPSEIEKIVQEARPGAQLDSAERSRAPGSRAIFRSTLRTILKDPRPAERAISFDDGTGHSLDTLELARVVGQIADSIGQPLDLLGMDACLMGNIEVAYELRQKAAYLVASEELVPGHSWPYEQIYGALRANPDQSPRDLAKRVVDDYVGYYSENPPAAGDVTQVALDLSRIDTLSAAVGRLGHALGAEMGNQASVLWDAQLGAKRKESQNNRRKDNKFQFKLWDLGSIATRLAANPQASPLVKQAALEVTGALQPGGAVVAEGHYGEWFDGIGGVSIYLVPPDRENPDNRISPFYEKLGFAQATQWNSMLQSYFDTYV